MIYIDFYPISPLRDNFVLPTQSITQPPSLAIVMEDANLIKLVAESSVYQRAEIFENLKRWMTEFLKQNHAYTLDRNQLVFSAVSLVKCLIRFGIYTSIEDIIGLISQLLPILLRNDNDLTSLDVRFAFLLILQLKICP